MDGTRCIKIQTDDKSFVIRRVVHRTYVPKTIAKLVNLYYMRK